MKKKVIIIVIVILVILGGIIYFIGSIKKDQEQVMENIDKVNTYYDEFSESASKINEVRHRYSDIISNTYYEELDKNNNEIVSILDEYSSYIEDIKKSAVGLDGLCGNYYSDSMVNQKCASYKNTMESLSVYYKSDVDGYNEIVKKYNEQSANKINEYNIGK